MIEILYSADVHSGEYPGHFYIGDGNIGLPFYCIKSPHENPKDLALRWAALEYVN